MKQIFIIFALVVTMLILGGCSDDPVKISAVTGASKMRIEPSDCNSCDRCVLDFDCPRKAISIDPQTSKAVIDPQKCVNCKLCITDFRCPYSAIKDYDDVIAPSAPDSLKVVDSTANSLTINSDYSSGDDGVNGNAALYIVKMSKQANFTFEAGKTIYQSVDVPQYATIDSLEANTTYYFQAVALDEVQNRSAIARFKGKTLSALKRGIK